MKKTILWLGSILLLSALSAFAQGLGPTSNVGFACGMTTETETKQTLSDGTHITSKTISRFYRDSLGRTRSEEFSDQSQRAEAKGQPVQVIIYDPVENVQYFLSPRNYIAIRSTLELSSGSSSVPMPVEAAILPAIADPPPSAPSTNVEDLGLQLVQDVWAKGTRVTTTYAVGSIGNDQPIVNLGHAFASAARFRAAS